MRSVDSKRVNVRRVHTRRRNMIRVSISTKRNEKNSKIRRKGICFEKMLKNIETETNETWNEMAKLLKTNLFETNGFFGE